jgi:(1->4)-alpha-D-glucan 1-alpha-D-glucosylmutase
VREGEPASEQDLTTIAAAIARAKHAHPEADARVWQALEAALSLRPPYEHATDFALAVQQLTGPVSAKAIEDTAGYRYLRLLALNEVGGSPATFGRSLASFHAAMQARSEGTSLLASATHDTKRGEDVRARLLVLSEIASEWAQFAMGWLERARKPARERLDRAAQYAFLQTLVGAFPLELERAQAYMLKAVREAKLHTSWTAPDPRYEAALAEFVRGVLGDRELMVDVGELVARIARPACESSLAGTLVKLTAPGVPDFYQGAELWDFSLVDPDNRRPVDFALRRALLARARTLGPEAAMQELESGLPKLWLIAQVLALKQRAPALFEGPYVPLQVPSAAGEVLAFARGAALVVVVPRWPVRAAKLETRVCVQLPEGRFRSVLDDQWIEGAPSVRALWSRFPVALLVKEPPDA